MSDGTVNQVNESSFKIGVFEDTIEKNIWHYHNEFELIFVTEGTGKRIVGDSIEAFYPGDLIFLGPHLPHAWVSEKPIINMPSGRTLETVYVLFDSTVLPESLFFLPEFQSVKNALTLASRGLKINGKTLNKVSELMLQLPYLDNFKRLLVLYEVLREIGESSSMQLLASTNYINVQFSSKNDRLNKIHDYLMVHYKEDINLAEIANLVHLSSGSVCRFFKANTGMTIFEYLNKIKVDYACKLLMNVSSNITDIAFACGFQNLSHFNKQFKKHCMLAPREYRKQFC